VDNTYATIQHPTRSGPLSAVMSLGGEDIGDYATLSGGMTLPNDGSANSSLRGTPRDVSISVQIHSFCSLSYDMSIASSKASSPQGAI
jgi:hypothetical protein